MCPLEKKRDGPKCKLTTLQRKEKAKARKLKWRAGKGATVRRDNSATVRRDSATVRRDSQAPQQQVVEEQEEKRQEQASQQQVAEDSREEDLQEVNCNKLMEMLADWSPQQTAAQPAPQTLLEIPETELTSLPQQQKRKQ